MERKSQGKKKKGVMIPVAELKSEMPEDYNAFFDRLKNRIKQERVKAVLNANSALVLMYWDIGG